jgi:hypothetical protein
MTRLFFANGNPNFRENLPRPDPAEVVNPSRCFIKGRDNTAGSNLVKSHLVRNGAVCTNIEI